MERLAKILAQAGVASRRKSEELILAGRVKVNDVIVKEVGTKVTSDDVITVDNKVIDKAPLFYYLVNKPTGYLSTTSDIHKRRNILDLFSPEEKDIRLFPVHKLPYDAAGLLILTNDGDLTKKLTLKDSGVKQEYILRVKGIVIKDKIRQLRLGMKFDDLLFKPVGVAIVELDKKNQSTLLKILVQDFSLSDMEKCFEAMGHKIKNITRIGFDHLTLEGVERGSYRPLKVHEIKQLYRSDMAS